MEPVVLRGKEKSIFKVGGQLVKVQQANRNGEVVLLVSPDCSNESLEMLYRHRLPDQGRREDRLAMCIA